MTYKNPDLLYYFMG